MADRKITDLTALAAGSQATGDLLTIVDVSESAAADKNKKITVESLFKGIPGDVGIGTSSPSAMLHVNGGAASTNPHLRISADRGLIARLGDTSGAAQSLFDLYDTDGSTQIVKFTNGSGADFINTGGNLGIGTSSPLSQLHVSSSTGNADTRVGGTSSALGLEFSYDQNGSTVSKITSNPTYTNTAARLHICVDGDANADQLVLDGAGNVGIGTTNPTQKLSLENGTFKISGTSTFASNVEIGRVGGDNNLAFATGGTERLRIDSEGKISTGVESSPDVSAGGLCLDQNAEDGIILSFKSSDINHGITNYDETDTYFSARKVSGNKGGLKLRAYTDAAGGDPAFQFQGFINSDSDGSYVPFSFIGGKKSGTSVTNISSNRRILEVKNADGTRIASFTASGITFGNDTAAASALDDYEEGDWTPRVTFGSNDTGITYSSRDGFYIKIGRQVTCWFQVSLSSNGSATGALFFRDLPFTVGDELSGTSIEGGGLFTYATNINGDVRAPYTIVPKNNGTFSEVHCSPNSNELSSNLTNTNISDNTAIRGYFTYLST